MKVRRGDRPGVHKRRQDEYPNTAAHDDERCRFVILCEVRIRDERVGAGEEEGESAAHEGEVDELQQWVRPPATHLLGARTPLLADAADRGAPLAEAAAEEAYAWSTVEERVAQLAHETCRRAAKRAHVEDERQRRAADGAEDEHRKKTIYLGTVVGSYRFIK